MATVTYGTDDATANRALTITETRVGRAGPRVRLDRATMRTIGDRQVELLDHGAAGFPAYTVVRAAPDGVDVGLGAGGISWDDLAAIIASLDHSGTGRVVDAATRKATSRTVLDAAAQVAPAALLAGWQRFVLTAPPPAGVRRSRS